MKYSIQFLQEYSDEGIGDADESLLRSDAPLPVPNVGDIVYLPRYFPVKVVWRAFRYDASEGGSWNTLPCCNECESFKTTNVPTKYDHSFDGRECMNSRERTLPSSERSDLGASNTHPNLK